MCCCVGTATQARAVLYRILAFTAGSDDSSVFALLPIKGAVNNWQPSDKPVASYVSPTPARGSPGTAARN